MHWTKATIAGLLACLALGGCPKREATNPLLGQWYHIRERTPRKKHDVKLVEALINLSPSGARFKVTGDMIALEGEDDRVDRSGKPISFPPLRYRQLAEDRLELWHDGAKRQKVRLHWSPKRDKLSVCLDGGAAPPRSMLWLFRHNKQGAYVCEPAGFSWVHKARPE